MTTLGQKGQLKLEILAKTTAGMVNQRYRFSTVGMEFSTSILKK